MAVRSALRTSRPLPPGRFLVLISVRGCEAGRIMSTEKCNGLIGNRTRDLPACSIVPQPTTLPRALSLLFMVPGSLLLWSQEFATGLSTEPEESSAHLHNLYFCD
jgi:hypothetical protein